MFEARKEGRPAVGKTSRAISGVVLASLLLVGCDTVGDALNPAEWYKGVTGWVDDSPSDQSADFPKIANDKRPVTSTNHEREEVSKGLAADRAHAQYTEEALRREGNPTRPLLPEGGSAAAAPSTTSPVLTRKTVAPADAPPADVAATDLPPAPPPMLKPTPIDQPAPAPAAPPAKVPEKPAVDTTPPPPPPPPPPAAPSAKTAQKPVVDTAPPPPPPPPPPPAAAASKLSTGGVFAGAQNGPAPAQPAPAAPADQASSASQSSAAQSSAAQSSAAQSAVAQPPAAPAPVPQAAAPQPAAASPAPGSPAPGSVDDVYRRRLAQSAPDQAAPASTGKAAPTDQGKGIAVIPPADYRTKVSHDNGGALPLDSFVAGKATSSFQVGAVTFGEGTSALAGSEQKLLKDVVALYKQKGGSVRVIGHSASPRLDVDPEGNRVANRQLAGDRAAIVARELIRQGVPAKRIYAGSTGEAGDQGQSTEIYIDY